MELLAKRQLRNLYLASHYAMRCRSFSKKVCSLQQPNDKLGRFEAPRSFGNMCANALAPVSRTPSYLLDETWKLCLRAGRTGMADEHDGE